MNIHISITMIAVALAFVIGCSVGGCSATDSYQDRLIEDGYADMVKNKQGWTRFTMKKVAE